MNNGEEMKILHIIDYFQPQIGYQESYLAKTQIKKGYEVRVISSNLYLHLYDNLSSSESVFNFKKTKYDEGLKIEEEIEVLRLPTRSLVIFEKPWLKNLEKEILDFKPDAIHIHGLISITAIRVALLKKKLPNTKLIFDDHMIYIGMRNKFMALFYKIFKYTFSKIIKKNADTIVAITEETILFMEDMYGIPSKEVHLIPLGCDTKKFYKNEIDRNTLRKKLNIKGDEVVFCYTGKITEDKGIDLLVESSLRLMESYAKVRVLCLGAKNEDYFKLLEEKIENSNFKENFIFLPAVHHDDLYKYYSASDVGVWPKSCSISLLEAMSCEVPLIISDNSGVPQLIIENYNGFVYSEGDVEDLVSKMEQFLVKSKRKIMAKNARKSLELYDWSIISGKFEELYFK